MSLLFDILTWIFLIGGSFFSIVGGIGILRMPEFYSRLHGGGVTDTLGAALIIFGLMLQTGLTLATVKLVIILFFMLAVSPSSCHALARSAVKQGLNPVVDKAK